MSDLTKGPLGPFFVYYYYLTLVWGYVFTAIK